MQKACDTTSRAVRDAMTISHPGINENLIDATLEFGCRKRGATAAAFIPVVAGGDRANTLHYVSNNNTGAPAWAVAKSEHFVDICARMSNDTRIYVVLVCPVCNDSVVRYRLPFLASMGNVRVVCDMLPCLAPVCGGRVV